MTKCIIYLEGNIGSGKSTLIPLLSNKLKTLLCNTKIYEYPEPLHIWNEIKHNDTPLLKILYDFPHYADRFQYLALITRQAQHLEFLEKPGESLAIIERSYMSDKLFQNVLFNNGNISKLDMDIYHTAHIPQIKHTRLY
jgi:deoxyadenosine/deoxycytidine kinase